MKFKPKFELISEMMLAWSKNRSETPNSDLFSSNFDDKNRRYDTYRPEDRLCDFPFVISLASSINDDFFADLATYHVDQIPISAYSHIITAEMRDWFNPDNPDIVPKVNLYDHYMLACLGVGLGEVLTTGVSVTGESDSITYSACRRSLGYSVARSKALNNEFDTRIIINRWKRLRNLTGLSVSTQSIKVLSTLQALSYSDSTSAENLLLHATVKNALKKLIHLNDSVFFVEESLGALYPDLISIFPLFNEKFDDRMSVFLQSIELIQKFSQGIDNDCLAVGFLCNKLLPGSFEHYRIMIKLTELFPSSLMWYGIFCTTSKEFNINKFENGLFLKLMRDISMTFTYMKRPECDISLDELEVLSRINFNGELIKPIQERVAVVSIAPGVDILSRFKHQNISQSKTGVEETFFVLKKEYVVRTTKLLEEALTMLGEFSRNDPTSFHKNYQKKRNSR